MNNRLAQPGVSCTQWLALRNGIRASQHAPAGTANPLIRFLAAWFGAAIQLAGRWDTASCLSWCDHALAISSIAKAPSERRVFAELRARCLALQGDIPSARVAHGETAAHDSLSAALIEFYAGDHKVAERLLKRLDDVAHRRGDVETQDAASYLRSHLNRLMGNAHLGRESRESACRCRACRRRPESAH